MIAFGAAGLASWPHQEPAGPSPTYRGDIEPILAKKCVACHRTDGVAPFSLETFADVKKRASLVQYQVLTRAMPPHTARSDFGDLAETPPVTDHEAVRIQEWIRAGAPEGEGGSRTVSKSPDWRMGPPDLVLKPAFKIEVPAEGAPYWQAIGLPLNLPEGKALRGFDIRPASPQVLRSATVGLAVSQWLLKDRPRTAASLDGLAKRLIGSWAPGFRPWSLPEGTGIDLRKEDSLAVQLHLKPRGKVESGDFELALYFEKQVPSKPCVSESLGVREFVILADRSLTLETRTRLTEKTRVVSVLPEARFFASRLWVEAELPDGSRKALFDTMRWDPYWVGNYQFSNPPHLPKGSMIVARVTYDNDERCVANEGQKPKTVVSGPKLTDEMFRVHLMLVPSAR